GQACVLASGGAVGRGAGGPRRPAADHGGHHLGVTPRSAPFELPDLAARLRGHVEALAATPRPPGTKAHRQAAAYVAEHLAQSGFPPREVVYQEAGETCRNVLAEPWPPDERLPLVVVGAHYDSIPDSPGADDNASAVAALLELARWLPGHVRAEDCRARLQLVAYDLEEYGLFGSYFHSRDVQQAGLPLRGMISLEMLAYT